MLVITLLAGCASSSESLQPILPKTENSLTSLPPRGIRASKRSTSSFTDLCSVAQNVLSCDLSKKPTKINDLDVGYFAWDGANESKAGFSTDSFLQQLEISALTLPDFERLLVLGTIANYREDHIVAYSGDPKDGQTCAGSIPIGDFIGLYNNDGMHQLSMTAQNINSIVGNVTFTVTSPNSYATSSNILGWVYKDQEGHYWMQANAALKSQFSASINAWFASLGVTFGLANAPTYIGGVLPKIPRGETYGTCWPQSHNGGLFS